MLAVKLSKYSSATNYDQCVIRLNNLLARGEQLICRSKIRLHILSCLICNLHVSRPQNLDMLKVTIGSGRDILDI